MFGVDKKPQEGTTGSWKVNNLAPDAGCKGGRDFRKRLIKGLKRPFLTKAHREIADVGIREIVARGSM